MVLLRIEFGEGVVVINGALFEFIVFYQVDVFQSVVMGDDIVLVSPFANVQDTPVRTIDIDDCWSPRLPVHICMLCHRALGKSIAHIDIVAIVA